MQHVDAEGALIRRSHLYGYGIRLLKHLHFMRHMIQAVFFFILLSCSDREKTRLTTAANDTSKKPAEFVCDYSLFKLQGQKLMQQYRDNPTRSNKVRFLRNIDDSLLACWLGTPWDFYGTCEEPNKGKIACGYFVTTLLRDMGIKLDRIKLAQCASEEMIRAVCIKSSIYRSGNEPVSKFIVRTDEPGLYIVGLDFHTGFILNDGTGIYFIHANYAGKKVVEKEVATESTVLASSKYKVVGKVI